MQEARGSGGQGWNQVHGSGPDWQSAAHGSDGFSRGSGIS